MALVREGVTYKVRLRSDSSEVVVPIMYCSMMCPFHKERCTGL